MTVTVRPARAGEAAVLAALAVRSKGHWGYSAAFLVRFAHGQALTEDVLAANDVRVADRDGAPVGFCTLLHRGATVVLDDLWVDPAEIGRGTGRLLFEHARDRAAATGARVLEWGADPHAVGFYERMGAVAVGWADALDGRQPVMRLALDG